VACLRRPGRSDYLLGGTAGLAGQGAAAELEDELPVGQLVTLVGALNSVRQLARAHLGVPTGPALWRTWHPITLPRQRPLAPTMAPGENDRSWRSSCDLGHYLWRAGCPPVPPSFERIFGTAVELVEVGSVAELVTAIARRGPAGVALDAPAPGQLPDAVAAAGNLPVLRPLWRRQRNARGETDEVFDGYGLLRGPDIVRLTDGEQAVT
jgi:hypothetical protein